MENNSNFEGIPSNLIVVIVARIYKTMSNGTDEMTAIQMASQRFGFPEETIFAIWRRYKDTP